MALDVTGNYAKTLSQKLVKQFIEAYRESPELWDPMHENYGNPGKRAMASQRLLEVMKKIQPDATHRDVRAKINSIRSNYKKLKSKVEEAKAEGKEYIPKNWSYKYLRFLDSIKKPDNHKPSPESEDGYDSENEVEHYKEDAMYVEVDDASHDDSEDVKYEPSPAKKHKVEVESTTPKKYQGSKRISRFPGIVKEQPSTSKIEPIAMVWSSKLQSLRFSQRLLAEKAINDVLFEASLNNLGKGALVINTGSSVTTDPMKEEYLECSFSDDE